MEINFVIRKINISLYIFVHSEIRGMLASDSAAYEKRNENIIEKFLSQDTTIRSHSRFNL